MNPIRAFIESGVLELYVMGAATPDETIAVEEMAAVHPEIKQEIEALSQAMESYAFAHAVKPKGTVKPMVLASIDYIERMKQGELPSTPPHITKDSKPDDFATWLNRDDMLLAPDAGAIYAKIIGYSPAATTAIVWIRGATDKEVHHDEYERFLILEGTCNFWVDGVKHEVLPGDTFSVPLHAQHHVEVTSEEPCKAILQRTSIV